MPFQPGSGNEFISSRTADHQALTHSLRGAEVRFDPLHAVIAEMDCVMSPSQIPDLFAEDDDSSVVSGPNLFSAIHEASDEDGHVNMLRQTGRNRAGQGRVLALRRRAMRHRLRQAASARQTEYEQRRLRIQIVTPPENEFARQDRPSVPLRLATHAIGLSLVATALPVGAAMMTYNLLKGEDIKVTARLTTLTGLALAVLAGNPALAHLIGA